LDITYNLDKLAELADKMQECLEGPLGKTIEISPNSWKGNNFIKMKKISFSISPSSFEKII